MLQSISAHFKQGEVTTIIGPNGAGKTTLLKCLAGVYSSPGTIFVNDQDLYSYSLKDRAKLIGYVPQASGQQFPLTVMETVLLGRKPYIKWGVQKRDLQIVDDVLVDLELEDLADRYLDEISGGQRQKTGIARALAQEPQILMLDEPISALDIRYQFEVLQLVRSLAIEKGHLVILVLHDLELAARFSDTMLLLKEGKVWGDGTPNQVLTTKSLRDVYGVEAIINQTNLGMKITVERPINVSSKRRTKRSEKFEEAQSPSTGAYGVNT